MTDTGNDPAAAPHFDPPPAFGLQVGDVLSTSLKVFGANAVPFLLLAFVCQLPAIAHEIWLEVFASVDVLRVQPGDLTTALLASAGTGLAAALLTIGLQNVAKATMIFGTVEQLSGRHAPLGDSVAKGFSRFFPVIVTAILSTLAIVFGLMLCIVPGVLFALFFFVAVPVTVVEKVGPIDAMGRSYNLTEGSKFTIFLCLLIVWVFFFVIGSVVAGVVGVSMFRSFGQSNPVPFGPPMPWITWFLLVANTLITTLQTAVGAVICSVVYARLRRLRDGVDASALAEVFR
jgi:hypothetical protein